jgi:RNA polymerase sigma factor (sigma-70 family)
MTDPVRRALLYHFCRMQMPAIALPPATCDRHLDRTFELFHPKDPAVAFGQYVDSLHALDWYVCVACLESDRRAWELLFEARTSRSDCLLVDALRARAARLYPRDIERQESAVAEFWSRLLVADTEESTPILRRYDGQRPLIPWLIRVFQNAHVSNLRMDSATQTLPSDPSAAPIPEHADSRWHAAFCTAARECFDEMTENDLLILGLRLRYRMSQRDVAALLKVHEGTISRQTDKLRDRFLEQVSARLAADGWAGDDVNQLVLTEMGAILIDEPRLSADRLAAMLASRGQQLPAATQAQNP